MYKVIGVLVYLRIDYHPERDLNLGLGKSGLLYRWPKPLSHQCWTSALKQALDEYLACICLCIQNQIMDKFWIVSVTQNICQSLQQVKLIFWSDWFLGPLPNCQIALSFNSINSFHFLKCKGQAKRFFVFLHSPEIVYDLSLMYRDNLFVKSRAPTWCYAHMRNNP